MERYVYIGLTLALTVYGQLIIKSRSLGFAPLAAGGDKVRYLVAMYTDLLVLSGLAAVLVAGLFWLLAIEKTDIGFAYPFMAFSFVLVPTAAAFLFKEPISILQTVGLAMIVIGVAINALAR